MNNEVAARLIDLNRQFYQTFAVQFAATRRRLQPGVTRVLASLPLDVDVLDLGCGNGELARALVRRSHRGSYLGLDFSEGLLSVARQGLPANFAFSQVDFSIPGWGRLLQERHFTYAMAFAVLHHLPGRELRLSLLSRLHAHLVDGGRLVHSEWQFLNSPRLLKRVQPWESVNLSASQVDEGDYLMDWRKGGSGLRYVHLFSQPELEDLAQDSGFHIVDTFFSDGEGGRLGLYQVWEKHV